MGTSPFTPWPAAATAVVERRLGDRIMRVYADAPRTVPGLLDRPLAQTPAATAVTEVGGRTCAYAELREEAELLAAGLQARYALAPGERVALLYANGVDFCVALLATLLAGGVAVPLNTKYTATELAPLLVDSGARVLLGQPQWQPKVADLRGPGALEHVALADGAAGDADRTADIAGGTLAEPALSGDEPALLVYTSGTTGWPKGAVLTHRNVVNAALTYARCLELGPEDRTVVAVPLFHVTGLNGQLLPTLASGGSAAIMPRFDAGMLVSLLAEKPVTFFHAAPAVYALALEAAGGHRASALRLALCGGGAISAPTAERVLAFAPAADLRTVYGLTETSSPATLMPAGGYRDRPRSSGVAVPVDDIAVDAPAGEPGEVLVRGTTVAAGYHGDLDVSARVFADGWLHTGDVGVLDDAGFLTIVDRLKDMINRGGEKISSLEVEHVLHGHPAVADCAVVAARHEDLGEVPRALVVLRAGAEATAEELTAFAAARLAKFKVPAEIDFVGALPRTSSGKLLKHRLRKDAR